MTREGRYRPSLIFVTSKSLIERRKDALVYEYLCVHKLGFIGHCSFIALCLVHCVLTPIILANLAKLATVKHLTLRHCLFLPPY